MERFIYGYFLDAKSVGAVENSPHTKGHDQSSGISVLLDMPDPDFRFIEHPLL